MGAREKGRGRCCGRVTVFALGSADSRGKSHCWRPEEQGRSLGCECGRGWRTFGEKGGPLL